MRVYIKEWPDKTATIMTGNGLVIWTFSSTEQARQACAEWQSIVQREVMGDSVTEDRSGISSYAWLA